MRIVQHCSLKRRVAGKGVILVLVMHWILLIHLLQAAMLNCSVSFLAFKLSSFKIFRLESNSCLFSSFDAGFVLSFICMWDALGWALV